MSDVAFSPRCAGIKGFFNVRVGKRTSSSSSSSDDTNESLVQISVPNNGDLAVQLMRMEIEFDIDGDIKVQQVDELTSSGSVIYVGGGTEQRFVFSMGSIEPGQRASVGFVVNRARSDVKVTAKLVSGFQCPANTARVFCRKFGDEFDPADSFLTGTFPTP